MKLTQILFALASPLPVLAQPNIIDPEFELGQKLAHCTGVFSMVRAAPASFKLSPGKSDAETLGQLSMLGAYVLLGPGPGKVEVSARLTTLRKRLDESQSSEAFAELINTESAMCSPLALENSARLKPRITKMLEAQK